MTNARTTTIQRCIERLNAKDPGAKAELLQITHDRLLAMLRAQMPRSARLRRWEQSDDVLQNVHLRLLRCFDQVQIESPHQFLCLAATNMRRELIDLARHYFREFGLAKNHASPLSNDERVFGVDGEDGSRLSEWAELHEFIATLPDELREVVDLHWYHDLTKSEVAAMLGVSTRTVRRRWVEAKALIAGHLVSFLDFSRNFPK
jgi:RNA polymerase sigma factor (sigma-70 family)